MVFRGHLRVGRKAAHIEGAMGGRPYHACGSLALAVLVSVLVKRLYQGKQWEGALGLLQEMVNWLQCSHQCM